MLNIRDAFARSADEYALEVMRLLRRRRADMDETWGELEEGWHAHNERMVKLGLSSRTSNEGAVKLNVGGSDVTVSWHLLAEAVGFKDSTLGALLEGTWDEGRIPRDVHGRIVLDESPTCIKDLIHAMITGRSSAGAVGILESASNRAVSIDKVQGLIYTAHVMGLPGYIPAHPDYVKINGGSTILEPYEIGQFSATIRNWVGGSTDEMTLIYRATRDGFDNESFKTRCNEYSPETVSVIRVRSGKGNTHEDSVVGSYSVVPLGDKMWKKGWALGDMFVFMLTDGRAAPKKVLDTPVKWHPSPDSADANVRVTRSNGACFGGYDLVAMFDGAPRRCILKTGRKTFDIEKDSPFLALNGKKVVEIEVYRYSTQDVPTPTAPSLAEPNGDALSYAEAQDARLFGESIASSLTEERVVLDRAVKEMGVARARVAAAADALETVYGPSVAAGGHDAVIELNVRGTRMTTLLSTLQACPSSALAVMFNEDRWPAIDNDKDEHGRRLVDCDPAFFSKILDVLRMRKRSSWSQGATPENQEGSRGKRSGAIVINKDEMDYFLAAVDMYFPGCESFILDLCSILTIEEDW